MNDPLPDPYAREFSVVLAEELKLIRARRLEILRETRERPVEEPRNDQGTPPTGEDADRRMTNARLEALGEHLTGLSFSGGGIRSGTFAVGLLQGLAALGLLRRFDYLSTVSGGGYAGGWLAAWLKRDGSVGNVEQQLAPSRVRQGTARRDYLNAAPSEPIRRVVDEEPEPIRHLRAYSSYMAPQLGLLTADTWTIILIWLRNVLVNMLMFLPLAVVLVLIARLFVNFYGRLTSVEIGDSPAFQILGLVALAFGVSGLYHAFRYNGLALREFRRKEPSARWEDEQIGIYYRMVYPTLGAAFLLSLGLRPVLWMVGNLLEGRFGTSSSSLGLIGLWNVVGHAAFLGLAFMGGAYRINQQNGTLRDPLTGKIRRIYLTAPLIAGASGGVLLTLVEAALKVLSDANRPELVTMLGTPAMLLVLTISLIIEVALLGRTVTEAEREWWSRFGALILISGLLWVATFAVVLWVPALFLGVGLPVRLLITSGWLGTLAAGVLAGRKVRPADKGGSRILGLIAAVAPPIFMVGLVGLVALLTALLVNDPGVYFPSAGNEARGIANYMDGLRHARLHWIVFYLLIFGGLSWIGYSMIDVNLFSLNAMYANRLIRCYLGATRAKKLWHDRWAEEHDPRVLTGAPTRTSGEVRNENPVTGFDPTDDIDLIDLKIGYEGPGRPGDRPYRGPMLLVNTTINLVGGDELAWRDRKGESFTLSPLYCGSRGTGYARVGEETRQGLTLGRAMSISGAAVDPNMRFYQSASLTAFLTLMNARLGYWLENPFHASPESVARWSAESPKLGNLLFTEFLGGTDGRGDYVHLSDGGHFENMGVYELIRRRCRYIVACDAGEDTGPSDENLAILMRLVRIDFGVRIEMDTEPFRMEGPDNLARAHVIIGRVHYEDVDSGQLPGILVYVRISMTGDEPSDVQQYARSAPDFPHQPTDLKQSFTEDQFESYRSLGAHIARSVFVDAVDRVRHELWKEDDPHREFVQGNRRLFSELAGRWVASPLDQATRAIESSEAWIALRRDFRREEGLGNLVDGAFPESAASGLSDWPIRPQMQAVGQMLQMMENAWLDLGLAGRASLPTNRGWMNTFRRWVGTEALHRYWPVFRAEISPDFARFLEKELHVASPRKIRRRLADVEPASFRAESIRILAEGFDREWPRGDAFGRRSDALVRLDRPEGVTITVDQAWLLFLAPSGPEIKEKYREPLGTQDDLPDGTFVVGIAWLIEEPQASGEFEFFAWVRRPHRASGIGNRMIGPLIEEIRREQERRLVEEQDAELARFPDQPAPSRSRTIWTRYPKSGRDGDDDSERGRWLNFFSMYDFQPKSPDSTPVPCGSSAFLKITVPEKHPRP